MFAIRHYLTAILQDRKGYIESMINDFSLMKKQWEEKIEKNITDYAVECAENDYDEKYSIKSQLLNAYEANRGFDNIFYQSMLAIVYSYYDSFIERLYKENNITLKKKEENKLLYFCKKMKISLSKEATIYEKYINRYVRSLRNDIIHNNTGTLRNKSNNSKIMNDFPEISTDNDIISIYGSNFIIDALEKEYFVLYEVSQKLDYKTIFSNEIR